MSGHRKSRRPAAGSELPRRVRGFTLIELMIALLLGLLVVAAASAIFLSNRQTYVATESLARVQESARVAFELMARDIREAAGNPCDRNLEVANVLSNADSVWWSTWGDGVVGYGGTEVSDVAFGTGPASRVLDTDAIELKSAHAGVSIDVHDPAAAAFTLPASSQHGIEPGDIALVCDFGHAAIFQASSATSAEIGHVHAAAGGPGNGLGLPIGSDYTFMRNSVIAKLHASQWYVGNNPRGGTSLYRSVLRSGTSPSQEEVVEGVTDMSIEYLVAGAIDYVPAGSVAPTSWEEVSAVRVTIELEGNQLNAAGDSIGRQIAYVAAIRNRNI